MKVLNSAGIFKRPRSSNLAFGLPLNPISESSQPDTAPADASLEDNSPPESSSGTSLICFALSETAGMLEFDQGRSQIAPFGPTQTQYARRTLRYASGKTAL